MSALKPHTRNAAQMLDSSKNSVARLVNLLNALNSGLKSSVRDFPLQQVDIHTVKANALEAESIAHRVGEQLEQISSELHGIFHFKVLLSEWVDHFESRGAEIGRVAEGIAELEKELQARLSELRASINSFHSQAEDGARALLAAKEAFISKRPRPNSDAKVGDFVDDIYPYFYGKKLTYVDVGAFRGDVFLAFLNSKLKLREAHLFEPNEKSLRVLERNTRSVSVRRHIYKQALADEAGIKSYIEAGSMTKMLSDVTPQEATPRSTKVGTLDEFRDNFTDRHVHLLKIDVEGFELQVLQGAGELLSAQKVDVIYIEVGFSPDNTQQTFYLKVVSKLQKFGYRLFKIYEQKNEWINDSPLLRRANFAFMSESFAKSNPASVVTELIRLKEQALSVAEEVGVK